jgi:hypothetical protein
MRLGRLALVDHALITLGASTTSESGPRGSVLLDVDPIALRPDDRFGVGSRRAISDD